MDISVVIFHTISHECVEQKDNKLFRVYSPLVALMHVSISILMVHGHGLEGNERSNAHIHVHPSTYTNTIVKTIPEL